MIATAREALRKAQEALDETLPCAVDEAEARQPCAARLSSGTWARTR